VCYFAYVTSEKGHEAVRDRFLTCVRNEKGRSAVGRHDFTYVTSEKGHDADRDRFLACARNEKGHSAVGGHMILHMSRVNRVMKMSGFVFWHVSAVKRVTQLLEGISFCICHE
jgi:hypothetical protein